MVSSSGFRLVYASESTSVLCIRVTALKELNGTVYTVFLAPSVLIASHVSSQLSQKADVGISRLAFNARTAWTILNQGIQTQTTFLSKIETQTLLDSNRISSSLISNWNFKTIENCLFRFLKYISSLPI